jgi:hypothetical protein
MVILRDQLVGLAMAQLSLNIGTAAQIPLFPESHTEGYKFDPLLYVFDGGRILYLLMPHHESKTDWSFS